MYSLLEKRGTGQINVLSWETRETVEERCPTVSHIPKSSQCQQTEPETEILDASIKHLEKMGREKHGLKDFVTHLHPKMEAKLVKLVGKRCVVSCQIGGVQSEGLWDTSAHILSVEAVGGHKIPY